MRVVPISDTHRQHESLELPDGDLLVHAGDWTHSGEEDYTIKFLQWFNSRPHKHKAFVAGNHDHFPEKFPLRFRELVAKHAPNCIYLEDETVLIEGYKVHGSPVTPFYRNWAFNRHRGPHIQMHWDKIPDDVEVLITHCPIYLLGDQMGRFSSDPFAHAGCQDLRNTIEYRLKHLQLHICGHIHEGAGMYQMGFITSINAAVLDERHRLRYHKPTFDLQDKNADPTK